MQLSRNKNTGVKAINEVMPLIVDLLKRLIENEGQLRWRSIKINWVLVQCAAACYSSKTIRSASSDVAFVPFWNIKWIKCTIIKRGILKNYPSTNYALWKCEAESKSDDVGFLEPKKFITWYPIKILEIIKWSIYIWLVGMDMILINKELNAVIITFWQCCLKKKVMQNSSIHGQSNQKHCS